MGDAGGEAPNGYANSILAAFAAFPSPASVSSSTPLLEHPPKPEQSPLDLCISRHGLVEAESVVPADPDLIRTQPVMTPPAKDIPQPDLNMIVGGALAPTHTNPTHPPISKCRPGLRLPSFDMLGIAAPHPDRFGIGGLDGPLATTTCEITPESIDLDNPATGLDVPLGTLKLEALARSTVSIVPSERLPGRGVQSPTHQYGDPLTPPDDIPGIDWNNATLIRHATDTADGQSSNVPSSNEQGPAAGAERATGGTNGRPGPPQSLREGPQTWYQGAVKSLVENVRSAPLRKDSLKILSHALPSPSPSGHVFSSIISSLQGTSPVESWINVFHAIPGRFNLADLPRSPPSTPGPAVGGSDYFTEKVFDSAVSIADYQEDLSQLPRSPRAVVPPGSIDISIVERYIPPTSSNEFDTMFDLNGQSILVDRLKEISANHGSLLLIYPTKTGGVTFMKDYLSPVLDPILRSMAVVHGLSASLAGVLGGMASVNRLLDHEMYERRVESLLARIARGGPAVDRVFDERSHPVFTLSHASRQYVTVERSTWAQDWWTKQEKPRIREAVTRYAREAQMKSSNLHVERPRTSTELLHELLKGVAEKPYPPGQEPANGIEVSVFVIRRIA